VWEAKDKPHYIVPWAVILASYVVCIFLLLAIRWGMKRENDRRDKSSAVSGMDVQGDWRAHN
jgi:hypothetical protein